MFFYVCILGEFIIVEENEGVIKMELVNKDGNYQFLFNGEFFYIKGAGFEFGNVEVLVVYGGNLFCIWCIDNGQDFGQEVLDCV